MNGSVTTPAPVGLGAAAYTRPARKRSAAERITGALADTAPWTFYDATLRFPDPDMNSHGNSCVSLRPTAYRTLPEALVAAPPDRPFVTIWQSDGGIETATFGEFVNLVKEQARLLRKEGLEPGGTVILIMQQGIPLMAAFMAAMYVGAVPAILAYPNFKVEPSKYRFGLTGVSSNLKAGLVIIDEAFPDELLGHVSIGDKARLFRYGASSERPADLPLTRCDPDRVAFIQHSAGTTGLQKGVALSHSAVLLHLGRLASVLELQPWDLFYNWLPLYHDMGLIACFMLPMACHLPLVMQSPTDWVLQPYTMLELITRYRCTIGWVPNFTLQFLARRVRPRDRGNYNLRSLRALINCSEPVRACSMNEFWEAFRICGLRASALQTSYAMAETVFAVTQSSIDGSSRPARVWVDGDVLRKEHRAIQVNPTHGAAVCYVSSGTCLPNTRVRIASSLGEDLQEGGVGEILIQSDSMLDGYYNRPDLTAKALQNGWYWSGDLGFRLGSELFVVGRKKDLIIVAGENIYPQDVEEIVSRLPAIHDGRVIAFGHYNPELGTEDIIIVAEVVNEDDLGNSLAIERDIKNAVVGELGVAARQIYLKPPKWIVKSTAGKPARSTTREKLLAEHPELMIQSSNARGAQ